MHAFAHVGLLGVVVASALGALVMCLLVAAYGFPSPRAESTGDDEGAAGPDPTRRLLLTRLGHAAAAVCFAAAGILAVLVLVQQARADRSLRASGAATGLQISELCQQLGALTGRLDRAEARLAGAETRVAEGNLRLTDLVPRVESPESSLDELRSDIDRAQAGIKQLERNVAAATSRLQERRPVAGELPGRAPVAPRPTSVRRESAVKNPPSPAPSLAPAAVTTPAVSPRAVEPPVATPEPAASSATNRPSTVTLKDRIQDDWETIKRDTRSAGQDIKNAFRRFREWLSP